MAQTQKISRNNTAVYTQEDGTREVYLHKTRIVSVTAGNEVTLNTGGWLTATTCARMNQAANEWRLGFSVSRAGGVLSVRFHDGRIIEAPSGRVTFQV